MFSFIKLGTEQSGKEKGIIKKAVRGLLGQMGFGYAVKMWALDEMLSLLDKEGSLNVLDFGCGDGMYAFHLRDKLPSAEITAIDGDPESISYAQSLTGTRPGIKFRECRFENYESSGKYELIVSLDALYYSENGLDYLNNILDCVDQNGRVIISFPRLKRYYGKGFSFYTGWVDVESLDEMYSEENIISYLVLNGFEIEKTVHYPSKKVVDLVERQRSGSLSIRVLYPLYLLFVYFNRRDSSSEGTHFMLMAKKREI